jgi:hypothetical protein
MAKLELHKDSDYFGDPNYFEDLVLQCERSEPLPDKSGQITAKFDDPLFANNKNDPLLANNENGEYFRRVQVLDPDAYKYLKKKCKEEVLQRERNVQSVREPIDTDRWPSVDTQLCAGWVNPWESGQSQHWGFLEPPNPSIDHMRDNNGNLGL